MSYYRMTEALMQGERVSDLMRPHGKDTSGPARVLCLLWILLVSATQGRELPDAACVARVSGISPRQAGMVWQYCLDSGILRRGRYGYTARAWMVEQGILGRYKKDTFDTKDAFTEAMEGI